ncbi:hypothetical protein QOT17_024992 [Balamuthia mandrillaris]
MLDYHVLSQFSVLKVEIRGYIFCIEMLLVITSALDLIWCYMQCPIAPEDCVKTTFTWCWDDREAPASLLSSVLGYGPTAPVISESQHSHSYTTSAQMANKPHIFNRRRDFLLWKFQMMDLLQGVGTVAMLPRVEPDQSSGSTGTRVVQDEERPDPTKNLALALNFDKRCGKGRALLMQYLSSEIAMQLRMEQKNSLSEAWLWLLTKYDKEAEKEQTLLQRQMSQLHLIEGRINKYLLKFGLLLAQYRSVGGVLSKKEAIEMVLNNLSTSWLSFVMMVDNLLSQEKTWEGFISRILLQEERVRDKKSSSFLIVGTISARQMETEAKEDDSERQNEEGSVPRYPLHPRVMQKSGVWQSVDRERVHDGVRRNQRQDSLSRGNRWSG